MTERDFQRWERLEWVAGVARRMLIQEDILQRFLVPVLRAAKVPKRKIDRFIREIFQKADQLLQEAENKQKRARRR